MSVGRIDTKILVLGLDAMDPDLLLKWCDSGDLPTLAKLRDEGTWGRLNTFPGLGDDGVWPSFATGSNADEHGRYHYIQFDSDSYSEFYAKDDFLKREPFWKTLSDAGQRVAAIDIPKCPLTPGINGVQLADWRVHGRDDAPRSHPQEFAQQVIDKYGDDENDAYAPGKELCSAWTLGGEDQRVLHDKILLSVEKKVEMLEDLLTQAPWDLFLGVFKEAHCAGHQFWSSLAQRPRKLIGQRTQPQSTNPLKAVYVALDGAVARLLERVDNDTTVIVFSDLGMSSNFTGEHLLESVLLRLESNRLLRVWGRIFSARVGNGRFRRFLNNVNQRVRKYRSAIQLPHNESSGAIRINIRGRERDGRITPGEPLERLHRQLTQELICLRDPLTNNAIVEDVIRLSESLPGQQIDCLPDLLVIWKRDAQINGAYSDRIGRINAPAPPYRSGGHVGGGIFLCKGPKSGLGEQSADDSIVDLAPSIAAMLGVDLPNATGKALPALVRQKPQH
jgi:predicted AlkP superfamily phosphohydrolase/phosphomutase